MFIAKWQYYQGQLLRSDKCSLAVKPVSYTHLDVYKRQAITVDFLGDGWMTQDFQQEQMTDEDIGPILTAKEEGRRPD